MVKEQIRKLKYTCISLKILKKDLDISFVKKRIGEVERNFSSYKKANDVFGFSPNLSINNIFPGGMKTELWKNVNGINKKKISQFLDTNDVSNLIEFVINQKKSNIFKKITVFPNNDWH